MLPTTKNDTLSQGSLEAIKRGLIHYFYYYHHTMPLIIGALVAICFLVTVLGMHHRIYNYHESKHPNAVDEDENIFGWLVSTISGMALSVIFGLLMFVLLGVSGWQFTHPGPRYADTPGNAQRIHAMRYINTSIRYRKTTIPKLQHELNQTDQAYQKKRHPSDLDKKLESNYYKNMTSKITHDKEYVNKAHYLRVHRYNYL